MNNESVLVFDPVAPGATAARAQRTRLDGLAGRTVGIIDNAKPNFNHLADELAGHLVREHGVAHVVRHRKHSAAVGAGTEVLDRLAQECDLVIAGSGD